MSRIIVIANSKGGTGKSTLTYLLATNLSSNCKVAILDMDLQGSLSRLSDTTDEVYITTDKSILDRDSDFSMIFVDNPPYLSTELPDLILKADLMIIPMKPGIPDLLAIGGIIELISEVRKESSSLIVLNMVKSNSTITKEIRDKVESFGIPVANTQISDLVSFTRYLILKQLNNKAQKQLDNLTKEMLTALL